MSVVVWETAQQRHTTRGWSRCQAYRASKASSRAAANSVSSCAAAAIPAAMSSAIQPSAAVLFSPLSGAHVLPDPGHQLSTRRPSASLNMTCRAVIFRPLRSTSGTHTVGSGPEQDPGCRPSLAATLRKPMPVAVAVLAAAGVSAACSSHRGQDREAAARRRQPSCPFVFSSGSFFGPRFRLACPMTGKPSSPIASLLGADPAKRNSTFTRADRQRLVVGAVPAGAHDKINTLGRGL